MPRKLCGRDTATCVDRNLQPAVCRSETDRGTIRYPSRVRLRSLWYRAVALQVTNAQICGLIGSSPRFRHAPISLMSRSTFAQRWSPSSCGRVVPARILIRPFQPGVVRVFSKSTRITMNNVSPLQRRSLQPPGVIDRCHRVVDRAGAEHHQQPVILAVEDAFQRVPAFQDSRFRLVGQGYAALDVLRRGEDVLGCDVDVVYEFLVHDERPRWRKKRAALCGPSGAFYLKREGRQSPRSGRGPPHPRPLPLKAEREHESQNRPRSATFSGGG